MSKTILLEGHNLTLGAGTGIATYAKVLSNTLRDLGYRTEVLIGTRRPVDGKDPILGEVALHDAAADLPRPLLHRIAIEWRHIVGAPLGLKASTIRQSGVVVETSGGRLGGFSEIHAICDLEEIARFHFKRYGRLAHLLDRKPDLFHATHPIPIKVDGCPNVYTIHDLIPLRLPYATLDDKKYYLNMIRAVAKHADHIITVSEFSRTDIIKLLKIEPHRISNTYQSVHLPAKDLHRSQDEVANDLAAYFNLDYGNYFLFFSAIEPKKNLSRLIDAYASSGSTKPLVIVGNPAWQFEGDLRKLGDEKFLSYRLQDNVISPMRRVQHVNYLPLPRLISLLRGARAVLFPSLYEGFGLPVLEAMVAGTPVLTSNTSSLPEIAGDGALLVDPHDIEAIAAGIRKLDADDDLCRDLSQRGLRVAENFTPDRYKERLAETYRRILG